MALVDKRVCYIYILCGQYDPALDGKSITATTIGSISVGVNTIECHVVHMDVFAVYIGY